MEWKMNLDRIILMASVEFKMVNNQSIHPSATSKAQVICQQHPVTCNHAFFSTRKCQQCSQMISAVFTVYTFLSV